MEYVVSFVFSRKTDNGLRTRLPRSVTITAASPSIFLTVPMPFRIDTLRPRLLPLNQTTASPTLIIRLSLSLSSGSCHPVACCGAPQLRNATGVVVDAGRVASLFYANIGKSLWSSWSAFQVRGDNHSDSMRLPPLLVCASLSTRCHPCAS